MNNHLDYQVRFLAADGSPMDDVVVTAKSLAVAVGCAGAVGIEIGAAIFTISPKAEGRNSRPSAVARRKPDDYRQSDFDPGAGAGSIHQ